MSEQTKPWHATGDYERLEQALAHERGLREQLEKRLVEEARRNMKNGQLREAAEAELRTYQKAREGP